MPGFPLILLVAVLNAAVAPQSAPAPALPGLALDAYPPAARDAIARAHAAAAARPSDADAAGTLGRVLHAWEQ